MRQFSLTWGIWTGSVLWFWLSVAAAHGPETYPLQRVPVPPVPGLTDGTDPIVVDKNAAIALGKALFWDVNVGSDGMACGSCHFHAGADSRTVNQLNPGLKSSLPTGQTFEATKTGATGGANYSMRVGDFPFRQYANPLSRASGVTFSSDDVMASSGTFSGIFTNTSRFTGATDNCSRSVDPVYHVGAVGTRRVEPRNAPTVINAVFNHRNFWDGRANNVFNGSSPWGDRDPNAGVWVKLSNTSVQKQRLHLINSSLASLSTAPPLSDTEMACQQRAWPEIGRKLLSRQPLQNQNVHNQDSVLAPYSLSAPGNLKKGLNTTYRALISKAFNPKYRSYLGTGGGLFGAPVSGPAYDQVEANFAMFFGLALQMYQSTLISDQAPIDLTPRDANGVPTWTGMGYTNAKINTLKAGRSAFLSNHCQICHAGPTSTIASIETNKILLEPTIDPLTNQIKKYGPAHFEIAYGPEAIADNGSAGVSPHGNVVTKDLTRFSGAISGKLMDFGFVNTGVGDPNSDPGIDGVDDFGNPLSYSKQYVEYLKGNDAGIVDSVVRNQWACDFLNAVATNSEDVQGTWFTSADGLLVDGSREGTVRNGSCMPIPITALEPESKAFIPTIAAALDPANANKLAVATKAAFKVPTLRNVELTGPYMHNGSMSTLAQVVEFYARTGNFGNTNQHDVVTQIALASQNLLRGPLVEFLKTYTDDRVRYEKAPFDHPEIAIPVSHVGDHQLVESGNSVGASFAKDNVMTIPAVGANGLATPLLPFDAGLAP